MTGKEQKKKKWLEKRKRKNDWKKKEKKGCGRTGENEEHKGNTKEE